MKYKIEQVQEKQGKQDVYSDWLETVIRGVGQLKTGSRISAIEEKTASCQKDCIKSQQQEVKQFQGKTARNV